MLYRAAAAAVSPPSRRVFAAFHKPPPTVLLGPILSLQSWRLFFLVLKGNTTCRDSDVCKPIIFILFTAASILITPSVDQKKFDI